MALLFKRKTSVEKLETELAALRARARSLMFTQPREYACSFPAATGSAQSQVVGSSSENDWLAHAAIHAANVSKALKIRWSEGIELLREIAFFRNLLTDVPLLPPLLAKRPVLDRRWKG
jgi:hypothetical protein